MKISIITPSFNQADFLEQTIKSVVNQDYKNLEYLIFDGGSTDGSVEIIKKYAKKYPKLIKYWSKKDKGQVDALNQGLKKATGDIIAYLNSDDYYLPSTFTKVINYFKKHPDKLWLVGNCQVTEKKLRWTFKLKHLIPIHKSKNWLYLSNWINQPAVFLRKDLVNQVGQFNGKYHYAFDYDYWLRCQKISPPGRLKQPLAVFRIHQFSKSSTNFRGQFNEQYKITKKYTDNCSIISLHKFFSWVIIHLYNLSK